MKTAVSIPDDVYAAAERLAKRLRTSRSRLYSMALAEYLARHAPDEVSAALDRVVEAVGEADDGFLARAASERLGSVEW